MEKKFRLMIIDDDWIHRHEIYKSVLTSDFEIISVESPDKLFLDIEEKTVDGYLVDIVLNNWRNSEGNPQELIPVLEAIGHDKPISLVSSAYETLLQKNTLTLTINEIITKGLLVNSFFVWQDFEKEAYLKKDKTSTSFTNNVVSSLKIYMSRQRKINALAHENSADVGIICALGEEIKPILTHLEDIKTGSINNIHFHKGILRTNSGNAIRVVAAIQQEMGTVDAALVSSILAKEFRLNHLFMTGVCGGRDKFAEIGDIIIPHDIYAYQKGKITDKGFEINLSNSKSNINEKMIFENKCEDLIQDIFKSYITKEIEKGFSLGVQRPVMRFQELACGESVINKAGELDRISKEVKKPKLCGVDMESYAIYRLNETMNIKTLVIKSVMDLTSNKNDKYKEYAAYISANFLIEVLKHEIYKI
jgi:nucleoside phosphorylase